MKFWVLLFLFFISAASQATEAPVAFDAALEEIVARSTTVKSQEASLGSTRAKNLPARLFFVPNLSASASQTSSQALLDPQVASQRALEGTARLNLFKFGADFAAVSAANSEEDSQENLVGSEILKSENAGVSALVRQIQTQQEAEILSKIVKTQEESLHIARQRYDRGLLPQQEVDKLYIDLENAKASLIEVQLREYEANASLVALLGHARIRYEWPWKEKLAAGAKALLASFKPETFDVTQRPDWRAARFRLDTEEKRYSQNLRLMLPSLDTSFTYGFYDFYTTPGRSGSAWTGVLTLSVPLFDRLTNYSNARTQLYARSAAEQQLEQVQRTARSEWESSRKSFETALHSALLREKNLSLSRRIYLDNLRRFRGGRINANDLALDQTRLFNSERFVVEGWASVHLAFTRVCHALGRRVSNCR